MNNNYLGLLVRDTITGFEGVCIERTEDLYGNVTYALLPVSDNKDNQAYESTIPAKRLQVVEPGGPPA